MVKVEVELPEDVYDEVMVLAKELGCTLSDLVCEGLKMVLQERNNKQRHRG